MSCWGNYYRCLILFVAFLCLTSICSNYIIINFSFICMQEDLTDFVVVNGTKTSIYTYDGDHKKYIMWAVGAGTVLGTVPTNWLVVKFGAKWTFLVAGLISAASTALIPLAAKYDYYLLLFLRFVQGFAYSTDFAAIGIITVRWAPLNEVALFLAILTCFTGAASIITNSVTGFICESSFGWKYAYYLHAFVGLILFALWAAFYMDDPQDSKRVSERELTGIHKNKSAAHLDKKSDIPYTKLFTSPVVLIIWLNAFFEMSAVIFFTTYLPIYFHQVLGFSIQQTGVIVAIILGVNIPLRLASATFSDRITFLTEKTKIIIFNSISVGLSGLLLACTAFIPSQFNVEICWYFVGIMMCISVNCGGFYKCAALHARQHAHIVIAAIQFTKCLALFTGPTLVAFYVKVESNQSQWIPVYLCLGLSMFAANLISVFVFTDEPAKWTEKYTEVPLEEAKC
ncbi:unnamed protein product [Caenorhabditis nigoni]|uniref:Major facilitator superfamily (MFS) profile domain-containing protein n=2 Tax=Caenorhabditis nigoni TaxID=1611254 RepID=A0A2G5TIL6_9PELO|nr:hypothetical protein B9Z55_019477 [Caenorhabditis nigoni]